MGQKTKAMHYLYSEYWNEMNTEKVCTVCKKEVATNYCGDCGQKVKVKRSTVVSLLVDIVSNFFSLEKSAPATMLKLLASPNKIIDNYSKGYRNYYASPGIMLVSALTIGALHLFFIDPSILGSEFSIAFTSEDKLDLTTPLFLLIATLATLCITSFLTHIRSKSNFAKHLISIIYLTSVFFIITQLITDFLSLFTEFFDDIAIPTFWLLTITWNSIVFSRKKKFLSVSVNILFHSLLMALCLVGIAYLIQYILAQYILSIAAM